MNTEYIKALINWAIDSYQAFPKKSDYEMDDDNNNDFEQEEAISEEVQTNEQEK